MLPMLKDGVKGVGEMVAEAKRLGLVMSSQTLKDSEEFNDQLLKLKGMVRGVVMQVGGKLLPVVTKWGEKIQQWIEANEGLLSQKLEEYLSGLVSAFSALGTVFSAIIKALVWLGEVLGTTAAKVVLFFQSIYFGAVRAYRAVSDFAASALTAITDLWTSAKEATFGFFSSLWSWFAAIPGRVADAFTSAGESVAAFFSSIGTWLTELPGTIWDAITSGFAAAIAWVKEQIAAAYSFVAGIAKKIASVFRFGKGQEAAGVVGQISPGAIQSMMHTAAPARAGAPGERPGGVSVQSPQITVNVPPGTPQTLARRVAEASGDASAKALRRAAGDIAR